MKVIVHQAIGLHLPTGLAARLSQSLKKALAVAVILKEGFASIPAIHHMINRSGILDSKFSGHSSETMASDEYVNTIYRPRRL